MLENEAELTAAAASAMRELADTVTDAPPLRLSPRRQGDRAGRPAGRHRCQLWAVPLTAAVAVAALAISLVVIKDLPNGRVGPPTASVSSPASGVPAYYVALIGGTPNSSGDLIVGDTFTGARLASVAPPHGSTFIGVTAAADDRTFVVDTDPVSENGVQTWYLLTIAPGSATPARLTRLAIPSIAPGTGLSAMALSGSGGELAMMEQSLSATEAVQLGIYSTATGKLLHRWSVNTWPSPILKSTLGSDTNNGLSWVNDDRDLAFPVLWRPANAAAGRLEMRELDIAAGGTGLLADSHSVWSQSGSATVNCVDSLTPTLTANGKTVVCGTGIWKQQGKGIRGTLEWLAYSTSAPKAARILAKISVDDYPYLPAGALVPWADASGSAVVGSWVSIALHGSLGDSQDHIGSVSHGKFTPLAAPPKGTLYMAA